MQACSSITNTPLAGAAPLNLTSPSSKAKLLLIERRLTGGDSQPQEQHQPDQPVTSMAQQAGGSGGTNEAADLMDEDVQFCAELHPAHQQQQTPPGSGISAAPASKRRKTSNPKHRPSSGEPQQHDNSRGALPGPAAPTGKDAGPTAAASGGQRDRTPGRARASPRNDRAGAGSDGAGPGGSNPPMSPVSAGITGEQHCTRSCRGHTATYI